MALTRSQFENLMRLLEDGSMEELVRGQQEDGGKGKCSPQNGSACH